MKEDASMVIHIFLFYPFNTKQYGDSELISDERCLWIVAIALLIAIRKSTLIFVFSAIQLST